ncbi:Hypothetical predicted protein, partial [Pelobates cultripes]
EAGLSKADVGFELAELEEAARLVQEEEDLQTASDTDPRQPAALLLSETSSSDSSSETEDDSSNSIESESEDSSASLQRDTDNLYLEDIEPSQNPQSTAENPHFSGSPTPVPSKVVEVIDEDFQEITHSLHSSVHSQEVPATNCATPLPENITVNPPAIEYLEVTPGPNPLLIISQSDQEGNVALGKPEPCPTQTLD